MNKLKKVLLDLEANGLPDGDPAPETNAQAAVVMSSFDENNLNAIAVTGIAFSFPGDLADDASLWEALKQKRDQVTQVPGDRWASSELQCTKRSEPGRSITFSAGVLSRIDEFDAGFFGISPREAAWLDPQQRILLELSWEAMENAGLPPSGLSGTDCAV